MTEHALIMCREPGRHFTLDKGHEEGGSAYAELSISNDSTLNLNVVMLYHKYLRLK